MRPARSRQARPTRGVGLDRPGSRFCRLGWRLGSPGVPARPPGPGTRSPGGRGSRQARPPGGGLDHPRLRLDRPGRGLGCTRSRLGCSGTPSMWARFSSRSRRAITPSVVWSAPGSSTRAQISSSSSRGAVAPLSSVRPSATRSAARLRSARPNRAACATSRSARSCGTSMSPVAGASGTAAMISRSRSRRSRSSVNRRGSWPVSITLSTTPKTVPPSPAANASTTSSRRFSGVNPSSPVARS